MWKISFGNVELCGFANFCSSRQFTVDALSSHQNAIFRLYVRFHNQDWQEFSKGFSLRIKNNVDILLPPLCCRGSITATPEQSSKGTQPRSKHQEMPTTRETCRSAASNETHGAWQCSGEMLCSKTKHKCRAGGCSGTKAPEPLPLLPPSAPCYPLSVAFKREVEVAPFVTAQYQQSLWQQQPSPLH